MEASWYLIKKTISFRILQKQMWVSHSRVLPQGPILGSYLRVLGSGSKPRVAVPLLRCLTKYHVCNDNSHDNKFLYENVSFYTA